MAIFKCKSVLLLCAFYYIHKAEYANAIESDILISARFIYGITSVEEG